MSIIEVRDLTKLYRLGQTGRASLLQFARGRWRRTTGLGTDDSDTCDARMSISNPAAEIRCPHPSGQSKTSLYL